MWSCKQTDWRMVTHPTQTVSTLFYKYKKPKQWYHCLVTKCFEKIWNWMKKFVAIIHHFWSSGNASVNFRSRTCEVGHRKSPLCYILVASCGHVRSKSWYHSPTCPIFLANTLPWLTYIGDVTDTVFHSQIALVQVRLNTRTNLNY